MQLPYLSSGTWLRIESSWFEEKVNYLRDLGRTASFCVLTSVSGLQNGTRFVLKILRALQYVEHSLHLYEGLIQCIRDWLLKIKQEIHAEWKLGPSMDKHRVITTDNGWVAVIAGFNQALLLAACPSAPSGA